MNRKGREMKHLRTNLSYRNFPSFRFLNSQYKAEKLSRNVGEKLPLIAA